MAIRGWAIPNRGSSSAVSSMIPSSSDRVSTDGTSASATCTVASTTLSGSDQNIIATRGRSVR